MRRLAVGSQELVHGLIQDLMKNDMTGIVVELAVGPEEVDDAPVTGWTTQDAVQMIGLYTIIPAKLYTPTERGTFILWGRWSNGLENPVVPIGKFEVF